jgi:hypothetical protein
MECDVDLLVVSKIDLLQVAVAFNLLHLHLPVLQIDNNGAKSKVELGNMNILLVGNSCNDMVEAVFGDL